MGSCATATGPASNPAPPRTTRLIARCSACMPPTVALRRINKSHMVRFPLVFRMASRVTRRSVYACFPWRATCLISWAQPESGIAEHSSVVWDVYDRNASPFHPHRGASRECELPSIRGPDGMIRIQDWVGDLSKPGFVAIDEEYGVKPTGASTGGFK